MDVKGSITGYDGIAVTYNFSSVCPGCGGNGVQTGLDGIKVLCPVCRGTGVFLPVEKNYTVIWGDPIYPYTNGGFC